MKPVLIVDGIGSLQVLKTVRGHKKSLKSLVEYAEENGADLEKQLISVCHGEDEEALHFVVDMIKDKLHPAGIMVSVVGCAIGAHTGRGIIGVCFLDAPEDPYQEYLS